MRPTRAPTFCSSCGRLARAPGQRLCFPDSNYVCGSAASSGDAAPLLCTPRMTGGAQPGGAAPTLQQVDGGGSRTQAAPAHSPGGAQLHRARGALSPECRAAAWGAGAARGLGRSMSVWSLAPLPGLRQAAAGCGPGGASDSSSLAQPPSDLLSAPPPCPGPRPGLAAAAVAHDRLDPFQA